MFHFLEICYDSMEDACLSADNFMFGFGALFFGSDRNESPMILELRMM